MWAKTNKHTFLTEKGQWGQGESICFVVLELTDLFYTASGFVTSNVTFAAVKDQRLPSALILMDSDRCTSIVFITVAVKAEVRSRTR